ncbi:hypothetical protein N7532_006628 [Penicillium argentinense]|uniref:Queuine tRNA-ribosyltransferase accessory subunit 2 n=1 Tax=Penicillium argentinense TaxID=1131581 RepID=A0A9W9FG88_9EURO|nr:uncharacterized protein N7532_006628 [Penicillium argentinense]KAJ5099627.1 hypothetical protein N7532_006628 [Penicillium argentinense]
MTATTMGSEEAQSHSMNFSVLGSSAPVLAPRVGKLALASRKTLSTPHYVPLTSRGTVPHIAHDMVRKATAINSLYIGLEDFITRKAPAPVYKIPVTDEESRLRKFIAAAPDVPLIMAPRRFPAIPCPPNNTDTSIAILTSVGFRQLEAQQYLDSIRMLKPDIAIGFADLVYGKTPGVKRRGKMVDRTHAYTQDALQKLYGASVAEEERSKAAYFAPVLPLENTQQSLYLEDLEYEFHDRLSGLALYESASLGFIPEALGDLPRLVLSEPSSPHDLLRDISLGGDLLTLPFVGECSDAGIALEFSFPAPSGAHYQREPRALGIDLWGSEHAKDVSTLSEGCECYTCRNHHRAYINHLLNAKEMTAWALLQMHNYHVMDLFFADVRGSIQRGTFDEDVQLFNRAYVSTLPERTGEGPRLRGYQLSSGPNKRAPKVYGRLDDVSQKFAKSQSSVATPDTDASGLEHHGFAKKVR